MSAFRAGGGQVGPAAARNSLRAGTGGRVGERPTAQVGAEPGSSPGDAIRRAIQPADLISAIRAVAIGDAVVAPSTTRRLLDSVVHRLPRGASADPQASLEQLTPREREVLLAVARGLSNSEIAEELVLSEATVKTHVGRILAKLGLRDRVQIVVFAYDHGLVSPAGAES